MVALIVINAPYPFKIEPNEPLGAKGPPLVGEEVRKDDNVGKVGS